LEYRSLRFEFESIDQEWYQEATQINYPNDHDFTRITEPKHATGQIHDKTTIIREYPTWHGEPYYPVHNPKNDKVFSKYQELAQHEADKGIHFVGRLANYKYFNMDQAFENALTYFQMIEGYNRKY
jgi:UDP-galactopyranose mutase